MNWRDARIRIGILGAAGIATCPWGVELVTQAQVLRGFAGVGMLAIAIWLAVWEVVERPEASDGA